MNSRLTIPARSRRSGLFIALLFAAAFSCGAGTLAQIHTIVGDIEIELYDQDKPVTTQNFIRYVKSGLYQSTLIHRWAPGFVIQGGGFTATDLTNIDGIFAPVTNYGTITNEFNVGPRLSNVYGTIAMARVSGETNSANSQWFINLTNNAFLDSIDGGFTVFGHVVRGTNVLERFNDVRANVNGIYQYQRFPPFSELPILQVSTNPPTYHLFITDVAVLDTQARARSDGSREITWKSVSNVVNRIEFTTNFPPDWRTLASTNGTGGVLTIVDADTQDAQRFYRVRVDYSN